tara:strand:- start:948 stop:1664 length:717 start_codon:yes stop_codon:yes gene_type:complete
MERADILRLLSDYNANPNAYSDEDAEIMAQLARAHSVRFKRSGKAGRKLLFDLADTALLGMVPNEWRPQARGDRVFGEKGLDKFAGAVGTGVGMLGLGAGAIAGRGALWAGGKALGKAGVNAGASAYGMAGRGIAQATPYAQKAHAYAQQIIRDVPDYVSRAGIKSGQIKARYAQAKAGNLSSIERGKTTTWFSNLRDRFRAGENFANPMGNYNPNLLMLTDGGLGGVPLARGGGVML